MLEVMWMHNDHRWYIVYIRRKKLRTEANSDSDTSKYEKNCKLSYGKLV